MNQHDLSKAKGLYNDWYLALSLSYFLCEVNVLCNFVRVHVWIKNIQFMFVHGHMTTHAVLSAAYKWSAFFLSHIWNVSQMQEMAVYESKTGEILWLYQYSNKI